MKASEIGISISKEKFTDYLNSVQGGQFFFIKGYKNLQNEVSDYILRFGILYDNIKNRDIATMQSQQTKPVFVKHGVWIAEDEVANLKSNDSTILCKLEYLTTLEDKQVKVVTTGSFNPCDEVFKNRKAKGRIQAVLSYEVSPNHPMFLEAKKEILNSLVSPRQQFVTYDKEAKSCYSLEKEDIGSQWYIRDVLIISKKVLKEGDYPFKASSAKVAIKNAISKLLLTSSYRQFILSEGKFESITIQKQSILMDSENEHNEFFMALPEHVKAMAMANVETVEAV